MFMKFTLAAILAALLATTISAAIAAPKPKPKNTAQNNISAQNSVSVPTKQNTRSVPMTGAEWWQNYSHAEHSIGVRYRY